jgi:hypothetical protein
MGRHGLALKGFDMTEQDIKVPLEAWVKAIAEASAIAVIDKHLVTCIAAKEVLDQDSRLNRSMRAKEKRIGILEKKVYWLLGGVAVVGGIFGALGGKLLERLGGK